MPAITPLKHIHQHKYLDYREIDNSQIHGRLAPYAGQEPQG